jgi:hypothetical protein
MLDCAVSLMLSLSCACAKVSEIGLLGGVSVVAPVVSAGWTVGVTVGVRLHLLIVKPDCPANNVTSPRVIWVDVADDVNR